MTSHHKTITVLIAVILLSFMLSPAFAAGVVTDCTETGFKNAVAGGGLVTFNCGAPTIITLTSPVDITAPDTTIDGGSTITLSGGSNNQIIHHRSLSTPSALSLKNITLTGGKAVGVDAAANGGAIWSVFQGSSPANKPTLNLFNVTFTNNISALSNTPANAYDFGGAAVYTQGGYLNVFNSTFSTNIADGGGGAIHVLRSNLFVFNSTFTANSANGFVNNNTQGGAIYIDGMQPNGTATISDSTFSGNSAYNEGGAIYIHMYQGADAFTVTRSNFTLNSVIDGSRAQGGAISGGNGKVTITDSLFNGNAVTKIGGDGSGGGISMTQPAVITIANSTFFDNRANGTSFNANGGAIYIVNNTAQFKIINSTIARNYAGWVGGGISSTANGILQNTILANNTADNGVNAWGIMQQCSARLTNGGGNIQYPDRNPNPNFFNEIVCATGITIADPQLLPINFNTSPRMTMALAANSPAIDFGVPATCAAAPINNRDQRGQSRLNDGDKNGTVVCDSGAYEYTTVPPRNYTHAAPTLTWNSVTGAQSYQLQIAFEPSFATPLVDVTLAPSNLSFLPTGLTPPNIFFWRLRARQADGIWGAWTPVESFIFDT